MPTTTTTNIEHIALDGPIGLAAAIVIGLLLLAVFAWSLWRERNILGRRNMILFWTLRTLALLTVIWMLLAPMNVRVETSTTRKALAVIADVSGSMQTVDPAGTSDDLRWLAAATDQQRYPLTQSADRALAALNVARQQLVTATDALRQHKPERAVVDAAVAARQALTQARAHLQAIESGSSPEGRSRELARRLVATLDGTEFEAFASLADALEKGRTPPQKSWRESLPDLELRLAAVSRSMHELTRKTADEEIRLAASNDSRSLAAIQSQPRLQRVAGFLGELYQSALAPLKDKAVVQFNSFAESVTPLSDPARPDSSLQSYLRRNDEGKGGATTTDIAAVLEELNRQRQDQPLAGVFLLTDVAHNSRGEKNPRDIAATLGDVPVYIVPIGNTQHVRDLVLQNVSAPEVAMRNDDIVIEARLQAFECEGEICTVELLQDGEVVDFREVTLDSGMAIRTVRFERKMPEVGHHQFQLAITPINGELTDENNYDDIEVNVTRSDIKVLIADELPRWEYRYLTQLFRRDAKVEADELLFHPRLIATGRRAASGTFPVTVDEWDQYDVVLLGDLPPEHLPAVAQESLVEYLKTRGGTLVMIAGSESMPHRYLDHPLETILPVQPVDSDATTGEAYAFRVTDAGRDHHALMIGESEEATRVAWDFVNRFSPLRAVSPWRQPRPSAETLIAAVPRNSLDEAADMARSAFLCWQPVGRGRIVYLSGPDTYRLRFLRGDRLHYRFWGQLLRWAIASDLSAGSSLVRVRTDRTRYESDDAVRVTVRLADGEGAPVVADDIEVQIASGEDERTVPLQAHPEIPGEYTAEVQSLPPGVYRVDPAGPTVDALQQQSTEEPATASFTVQADLPVELVDTRSNRALAQQIADVTGGQVLPPTAVAEVLSLTNLDPIVTERIETRPLWLQWKYLWIVFGCLQVEWVIRKWKGLS